MLSISCLIRHFSTFDYGLDLLSEVREDMMEVCSLFSFSIASSESSNSVLANSTKEDELDLVVLVLRSFCPAVLDWRRVSLSEAGIGSRCLKSGSLTCLVGKYIVGRVMIYMQFVICLMFMTFTMFMMVKVMMFAKFMTVMVAKMFMIFVMMMMFMRFMP